MAVSTVPAVFSETLAVAGEVNAGGAFVPPPPAPPPPFPPHPASSPRVAAEKGPSGVQDIDGTLIDETNA
ncbi:MAG TPA: hypothetical protein VFS49_01175, partial [Croceibacterium sp.]|nr:hypothetical protein [Croceibacterium sp.]